MSIFGPFVGPYDYSNKAVSSYSNEDQIARLHKGRAKKSTEVCSLCNKRKDMSQGWKGGPGETFLCKSCSDKNAETLKQINNLLRTKNYDGIRNDIFAHRESFEDLVWKYLQAKQNGARLPGLHSYIKMSSSFQDFHNRVMNDIHPVNIDEPSRSTEGAAPASIHNEGLLRETISEPDVDVTMDEIEEPSDTQNAAEDTTMMPAQGFEGKEYETPETGLEEGEIEHTPSLTTESSASEVDPVPVPTEDPDAVRRRRIEMISNEAREATRIQHDLMIRHNAYPGNLNETSRKNFFETGVCNASLGFGFFHRAGFFPTAVDRSDAETVNERVDRLFDDVYAHGDLHGDFKLLKSFLETCGIATVEGAYTTTPSSSNPNPRIVWNPAKTNIAVIFIGDIVDRARKNIALIPSDRSDNTGTRAVGEVTDEEYYLEKAINELSYKAQQNNSVVIKLYGNHEFINRLGGTSLLGRTIPTELGPSSYMSDYLKFNLSVERLRSQGASFFQGPPYYRPRNRVEMESLALAQRFHNFSPSGKMNREISYCNPSVIFQINGHVFVHGGISLRVLDYVVSSIPGIHLYEVANSLAWKLWNGQNLSSEEIVHFSNIVGFIDSDTKDTLLWDRTFSELEPPEGFDTMELYIERVIGKLNEHNRNLGVPEVKGIVVGHSLPYLTLWDSSEKHSDVPYPKLRAIASNSYAHRNMVMDMIYQRQIIKKGGVDRNYVVFTDMNASRTFTHNFFKPEPNGIDEVGRSRDPDVRVRPLKINSSGQLARIYRDALGAPPQERSVSTWPTMPWQQA